MNNEELMTPLHYKAVCLIAAGHSDVDVAEATGITTRTLQRWRKLPEFKKLTQSAVRECFDAGISELVSGVREAASELKRIIADDDTSSRVKISAITSLLTFASKSMDLHLQERVENLENKIDGSDDINIIVQKLLNNAHNQSDIIQVLEFKRRHDESFRKTLISLKQEDIDCVVQAFSEVCLEFIPQAQHSKFLEKSSKLFGVTENV
jgi:hypothetical protein